MMIHTETCYFAGAQKMLGYFLDEMSRSKRCDVVIAMAENAKVRELIPESVPIFTLPSNQSFSVRNLCQQVREIKRCCRENRVDVVHGWTARDWELTALSSLVLRRPGLGTLHDHPQANFISKQRQRLMRWSARGLNAVVCVSHAVRDACQRSAYKASKLVVIHNGLPDYERVIPKPDRSVLRFGFLGVFSERKGLRLLFDILAEVGAKPLPEWEAWIGGGAQDEAGERLMEELCSDYSHTAWWPRIRWTGWVKQPAEFLSAIDLLLVPSQQFDPFPTVVLEAGRSGVPVLAANVGGIAELVQEGHNGWIFEPQDCKRAAAILSGLLIEPTRLRQAGKNGAETIRTDFSASKMVENYSNLYLKLKSDV